MKLIQYVTCIFFLLFGFSACKKNDVQPGGNADVYTAGYIYTANNNSVACYWKNGKLNLLADSNSSSGAKAIAVYGNDIYVAGYITSPNGNTIAEIWKDGIPEQLSDGKHPAEANAITIDGNNVYVAGFDGTDSWQQAAVYWKNNIENVLNPGSANAITFKNGNVYIAGYIFDFITQSYSELTAYWINGKLHYYPNSYIGNIGGQARGITVNNNDIYIVGDYYFAEIWKNDVATKLSGGWMAIPWGIGINGSDVYVVGWIESAQGHNIATYWKNGNAVSLTENAGNAGAFGIAFNGNDVYIVGCIYNNNSCQAMYWKNSTLIQLPGNAVANSIAVVPR